ncbi:MAG: hypothetical protein ACRD50_01750 [Candidatus Acidiferrales bacterium]
MALQDRLQYLRSEQDEILRIVEHLEKALELAAKDDFSERAKAISELRALDHKLTGISGHCHAEDRLVESTFHHNLESEEFARINREHEDILHVLDRFREELKFANADYTTSATARGQDLAFRLREHVAYERGLLDRIEEMPPVTDEVLMRYTESAE